MKKREKIFTGMRMHVWSRYGGAEANTLGGIDIRAGWAVVGSVNLEKMSVNILK
jgi:hypothetical protein